MRARYGVDPEDVADAGQLAQRQRRPAEEGTAAAVVTADVVRERA
ncbi:hypothetical protein ACI8AV_17915 [Geodermatophilus sp. SYSU D00804]